MNSVVKRTITLIALFFGFTCTKRVMELSATLGPRKTTMAKTKEVHMSKFKALTKLSKILQPNEILCSRRNLTKPYLVCS